MALIFSDGSMPHPEGGRALDAKDAATGQRVPVWASDEAIQDHGLSRVQEVASDKHDAGVFGAGGRVEVRTGDC